jgi:hypothetical protein
MSTGGKDDMLRTTMRRVIKPADVRRRRVSRRAVESSVLFFVVIAALALVVSGGASITKKPPTNGNSTGELGEAPSLGCASQPIGRGYAVSGLVITRAPKNHSDYSYTCHALIATIVDRYIVATHELKQASANLPPRWACSGTGASPTAVTCTESVPNFGVLLTVVFKVGH